MKQIGLSGIRAKLIVLVILPIAFFISLSVVSIFALRKEKTESDSIARDRMPKLESILLTRIHSNALMRFLWTSAAITDQRARNEKMKEVESRYEMLSKEINHFSTLQLSQKMKDEFAPVIKLNEGIADPLKRALNLLAKDSEDTDKQAKVIIVNEVLPKAHDVIDITMKCTDLLEEQIKSEVEAGDKAADNGQHSVIWLSVAGALILLVYGYYTSKNLYSSLDHISKTISQTQKQVVSASNELASASHQASAGSTQAASALEETAASIEELTSMVKINADSSRSASSLSLASIQSAQDGEKEIRNLIESMHGISQSSKKIEDIINVIDDIAFQTNLLALNASVEAARAGEHGRGFAVVAEAVRSLSQRSAAAAKDINQLIKDSSEKVHTGSAIADRSEVLLQNILNSIKKVADLNSEIATASGEQADGISQISQAMTELDTSVQQNAQASESVAQSSEKLAHHADLLQSSVKELENVLQGQKHQVPVKEELKQSNFKEKKNQNQNQKSALISAEPVGAKVLPLTQSRNVIPFDDETHSISGREHLGDTGGF